MTKRVWSLLLAIFMVFTMIPGTLQAEAEVAYTTLTANQELALKGDTLWVDLAGYDLTLTGSGTVYAFDSANDTYDAQKCGKITAPETVTVMTDVEAPNGGRYVAVTESGVTTMHRLSMRLTTVTLNIEKAGISYKAAYYCDAVLADKVEAYGVVVSLSNMPGADFKTEVELYNNLYTVAATPFQSGVQCVSGSVINIMKDTNAVVVNMENGETPIYANAYIDFGDGPLVADTQNPGKSLESADFTGVAHSLHTTMDLLDEVYFTKLDESARAAAEAFYAQWKEKGMDWQFENIGNKKSQKVDNSDLQFDEGTTNAVCPVCQEKVAWAAIGKENGAVSLSGKHYYLTKNLTFTGTSDAGYISNSSANTTACIHLNGYNITATQTRAIFGGSGRLNVMGNGIVSGYNKSAQGAAVQINNMTAGNGVYLYGGTYQKAADAHADAHTVAIWNNGTTLNIYEGAKVIASGNGAAVYSGNCAYANNTLGLYGCTIEGDVRLNGATQKNGKTSTVVLNGATVTGIVDIPLHASGTVSGAVKINEVKIHRDSRVTVGVLKPGAQIGVRAENVFTTDNAAQYQQYFTPVSPAAKIIVEGSKLRCGIDYTGKLQFAENTTDAVCPVCEKTVTWTALGDTNLVGASGGHYYLPKSIEYTGSSTNYYYFRAPASGSCCVHLNGFDITASARPFYGNSGVLNVMGSGNLSGQIRNGFGNGATVQIATSSASGAINLYGGTYRNSAAAAATNDVISVQDNGGEIFIGKDVVVEGNVSLGAAKMRDSALTIQGKVTGNVTAAGANNDTYTPTLTLDSATVLGTVKITGSNKVNVCHAPKITLDMPETTRLTMDHLQDGASITVKNTGILTEAHAEAEAFKQYFHTPYATDKLLVQDGCIVYKMNYTDDLQLDAQNSGFCPVCKETVRWEALRYDGWSVKFTNTGADHTYLGSHYYLPESITYTGTDTAYIQNTLEGSTVCLHLNGNDLIATKTAAIFGSSGALNIMGSGTVSGYNSWGSAHENRGSAIFLNNAVDGNGISLYAGNYTMQANTTPSSVISAYTNGGRLYIYEDVTIDAAGGLALHIANAKLRTNDIKVMGATIRGDVTLIPNPTKTSTILLRDTNITGTVTAAAGHTLTFDGLAKVGKLIVPSGVKVDFTNMKSGSSVPVSADGVFSNPLEEDSWLQYFSTDKVGDWLILRYHALCQNPIATLKPAGETEIKVLNNMYAGREPLHGEMHDHSKSGPKGDGKRTLAEIKAEMTRLSIDFTTLVDHKQSVHMYLDDWDNNIFVGGSEPGTSVSDGGSGSFHFNMIFADPEKLEEAFTFGGYKLKDYENGEGKYFEDYVGFKVATFTALTEKVYELGGLLVHVHPKYDKYMVSDDPLDYYFGSDKAPMGFEIHTGNSKPYNMVYKDNEEAYQTWVDLLEAGKWVYATAGSDKHDLPNPGALTTLYSDRKHADAYLALMRSGDFAPGWVGIRMTMTGVTMGGKVDFTNKKLIFSVGDIYQGDKNEPNPIYVADHTYRVELYDDGGLVSQSVIDPTVTTYFEANANSNAKFYRIVVWDDTAATRIGVSNPIWNTK